MLQICWWRRSASGWWPGGSCGEDDATLPSSTAVSRPHHDTTCHRPMRRQTLSWVSGVWCVWFLVLGRLYVRESREGVSADGNNGWSSNDEAAPLSSAGPAAVHQPAAAAAAENGSAQLNLRHLVYTTLPERYGKEFFRDAMKFLGDAKQAQAIMAVGPYGGRAVLKAFAAAGFSVNERPSDDWHMLWTQTSQFAFLSATRGSLHADLVAGRRLHNHCTLLLYAGDKCKLAEHLKRVQRLPVVAAQHQRAQAQGRPSASGFPLTYVLSDSADREAFDALPPSRAHYMLKPCVASGADGQKLWPAGTRVADLPRGGEIMAVMQQYLREPMLWARGGGAAAAAATPPPPPPRKASSSLTPGLGPRSEPVEGGVKFHLRLYVLVTSYKPMRVLLCRRGLVLRAASQYHAPDQPEDPGGGPSPFDKHTHLTNTAVNSVEPLPLDELWKQLAAAGASPRDVWRRIKGLMAKLLCTYHVSGPKYSRENCGACFDLFGVDLLLDRFFQPWVMEINEGCDLETHDDRWQHEQDSKMLLFTQISQWLKRVLSSRLDTPSRKLAQLAEAMDTGAGGQQWALPQPMGTEQLEHLHSLYLESSTLRGFDRVYPAVSDQFGALSCHPHAQNKPGSEDGCTFAAHLCRGAHTSTAPQGNDDDLRVLAALEAGSSGGDGN